VGFGKWINHPTQSAVTPPNAYVPGGLWTWRRRSPSLFGIILDLFGAGLAAFGAYKLF
jgi:hypothetical protein